MAHMWKGKIIIRTQSLALSKYLTLVIPRDWNDGLVARNADGLPHFAFVGRTESMGFEIPGMDSMWTTWSCQLNRSYGRGFTKLNAHHSMMLSSPNSAVSSGRLSAWRAKQQHQLASGKVFISNRKALGVDRSQQIMIILYRSHYKAVDDLSMWSIIVYDTRTEADPDIVTWSETTSCCVMITNKTTHLIDQIGCQI